MRPFEIVLIGIFVVGAIAGIIALKMYQGDEAEEQRYGARVVVWGTLKREAFEKVIQEASTADKALDVVEYVEKDARTFDNELLNAVAEGRSPDLIVLPHTLLATYRSKLTPLSFETIPERTFRDTYIDGAEIFMRGDGVYGIPFAVDPLVLYWNRGLFSSAGLATPPRTWEALISQSVPALVRKSDTYALLQSAIAFGEYANVAHAKEILSMLLFQAGTTIVEERDMRYHVTLNTKIANGLPPGDAVFGFYTQFSLPSSAVYSWNRSRSLDRTEFLDGRLAMYFGLGSEYKELALENPNLNFDVAPVPQGSGATVLRNYGTMYAFAIPRASSNVSGAYQLAVTLSSGANVDALTATLGFAPVLRSLYSTPVTDPFKKNIRESALIARGWLDPNPTESSELFKHMTEEITSGRTRTGEVMTDAVYTLEALFR